MATHIYQDHRKTFFCGCRFDTQTRLDTSLCGYKPRKNAALGQSLDWDHVVPPEEFAGHLACWQQPEAFAQCRTSGGNPLTPARCCHKVDPLYRKMETDLHNLVPVIGEIKHERRGYHFDEIARERREFGRCDIELDANQKRLEPGRNLRGDVARVYFYMRDTYGITIHSRQKVLFAAWNNADPPDSWEILKNIRVKAVQGIANKLVETYAENRRALPDSATQPGLVLGEEHVPEPLKLLAESIAQSDTDLAAKVRTASPDALIEVMRWAEPRVKSSATIDTNMATQLGVLLAKTCTRNHAGMIVRGSQIVMQKSGLAMDPEKVSYAVLRRLKNGEEDYMGLYRAYQYWLKHTGVTASKVPPHQYRFDGWLRELLAELESIGDEQLELYSFDVKQKLNDRILYGYILQPRGYTAPNAYGLADKKIENRLQSAVKQYIAKASALAMELDLSPQEKLRLFQNERIRSRGRGINYKEFFDSLDEQYIQEYYSGIFY